MVKNIDTKLQETIDTKLQNKDILIIDSEDSILGVVDKKRQDTTGIPSPTSPVKDISIPERTTQAERKDGRERFPASYDEVRVPSQVREPEQAREYEPLAGHHHIA